MDGLYPTRWCKKRLAECLYLHGSPLQSVRYAISRRGLHESGSLLAAEDPATPDGVAVVPPVDEWYLSLVKSTELPWIHFCRQVDLNGRACHFFRIRSCHLHAKLYLAEHLITHYMAAQMRATMTLFLGPFPTEDQAMIVGKIFDRLSSIMPMHEDEQIVSYMRALWSPTGLDSTLAFLKLAIYLLSNGLITHQKPICDEILGWFQLRDNWRILKRMLSQMTPTIQAFAQAVFSSAIQTEDVSMIRLFLDCGVDPNFGFTLWDHYGNDYYDDVTPLGFLAHKGNIELVQLLLNCNSQADFSLNTAHGRCPLLYAIDGGHYNVVKLLLEANTSAKCKHSGTLECAIRGQFSQIACLLLDCEADVNERSTDVNSWENTPLQSAAMVGDHAMVSSLLRHGAKVDASAGRFKGRTAIQWAATNGNMETVSLLLTAGSDLNDTPAIYYGVTALVAAVIQSNYELVRFLLDSGADVLDDRGQFTALEAAARGNDFDMVQLLLAAGANASLDHSLAYAIRNGYPELINFLLKAAANIYYGTRGLTAALCQVIEELQRVKQENWDPNCRARPNYDPSPNHVAEKRYNDLMKMLVGAGANCNEPCLNSDGNRERYSALQLAAARGDVQLVEYFISVGGDVNSPAAKSRGATALQAAAIHGKTSMVRWLLNAGADPNVPAGENWGCTALQAAATNGDCELVRLLLDAGANSNDTPSSRLLIHFSGTALQLAAGNGNEDVVNVLLDAGTDVNAPPGLCLGKTALQSAVRAQHVRMVELLLSRGADANAPAAPFLGRTALQEAADNGSLRIANLLLNAGADVNAPGAEQLGYTALEAAAKHGRIDMIKLLLVCGAKISGDGRAQFKRAIKLASEKGHTAAAKFLRYHKIYAGEQGTFAWK
jgi:ankyrin repeat protein